MSTSGGSRTAHVLRVIDVAKGRNEFMWPAEVAPLKAELTTRLAKISQGENLVVDFTDVGMSSGAAREFLSRALSQLQQGGALHGRGLVLRGLGRGRYDVKVMLESENLTAVAVDDKGRASLIGSAEDAAVKTYEFVASKPVTLAREVRDAFDLRSVAAATNRLVRLADMGVVRRIGQEPAEGGGLQYLYAAVR